VQPALHAEAVVHHIPAAITVADDIANDSAASMHAVSIINPVAAFLAAVSIAIPIPIPAIVSAISIALAAIAATVVTVAFIPVPVAVVVAIPPVPIPIIAPIAVIAAVIPIPVPVAVGNHNPELAVTCENANTVPVAIISHCRCCHKSQKQRQKRHNPLRHRSLQYSPKCDRGAPRGLKLG
jgi:hypothetical protein